MKMTWSHAVLYVRDQKTMIEFYSKILGFEVTDLGPLGDDSSPEIVFMSQIIIDQIEPSRRMPEFP